MAASGMNIQRLQELKNQARELASACQGLDSFLACQSDRLHREADIERLNTLTRRLKLQLRKAECSEETACAASEKADALGSIAKLFVKRTIIPREETALVNAFDETCRERYERRQHCFGFCAVCVGKGGLPDDAGVVCISELARSKNLPESEIVLQIERRGELVFKPDDFWLLVRSLIEDIASGQARLPILPQQIAVKMMSRKSRSSVRSQESLNSGFFNVVATPKE